ncbi:dockerin type I repeat-containing protein [Ruminococcus sp.]|uniref:dockerin type I repeat-containing protein n=1 Tax=Ruminococcus sp. TaxID=41978 RepID=UPI0025F88B93|nr:dockerin type I repeat-containing protein [Ruminococcus sp.]
MPKNCLDGFKLKTLVLPSELKFADSHATQDIKATYEEVIYKGTEEEWANVVIEDPNDPLRGPVTFSPDEVEEWKTGDANGDGEIDMSDIVLIMQTLANPDRYGVNGTDPTHITENGFKYGDVNGDGLTVKDAQHIQLYLLGKISSLV